MTKLELENKVLAIIDSKKDKARESFWYFCKTISPKMYKKDRLYLKEICDTLQALYEGKLLKPDGTPYKKLILNCPPGFGKSYTLILFSMWCFGKNKDNEIITVSYNEKLTTKFGTAVRDGIEEKRDLPMIAYNSIFPNTKIKYGDASKRDWALEGRHHSYLATSFRGTLTGMRGNIGIIDDPVKSAEEACNEIRLEENWTWYKDTFLSRMVEGAIQIVVQTRWSTRDLCGKLLETAPDDWYVLKYEVMDEDTGVMLCEELMSRATYDDKKKDTSLGIFNANYHQKPIDEKGKLYTYLQEWTELPTKFDKIISYTDTADEGNDYLASIIAGIYKGQAYLIDIYYTKDAMEITEGETAKRLFQHKVQTAFIESNNGGKGFSRSVKKLLYDNHQCRTVHIDDFHQSANKVARINSNATQVMDNIFFMPGWKQKHKEAWDSMNSYQREGKSKNDDLQDALTGIIEKGLKNNNWIFA